MAESRIDTRAASRPWQVAGALALAHTALVLTAISQMDSPLFADGAEGIRDEYVGGDLGRTLAAWYTESLAFLMLVPVLVFLSRQVGVTGERARWASQSALACGIGYVVVTFAVGFPAGAVAMYGAQHGLDVDTAFAINNLRIFSYFLSLMLLGGQVLGLAVAALVDGFHRRWVGGFGLVAGAGLVVAPALAPWNLQDVPTLVWMVWWVGLAVLMLRHRVPASPDEREVAADGVRIGQS
jgi:hypothetical protein